MGLRVTTPVVRCAIYTRQSVTRRGEEPELASCVLQRRACEQFIFENRDHGWIPLEWSFNDEGESGANMRRGALGRLIGAIEDGHVDRVVVHRLDRLTRSARDWVLMQSAFRERGVPITVVEGDVHGNSDAITQLRLNALAIFAEFEREMISERLRDGRAVRRARGLRTAGRVPFGYIADDETKQLVIHAREANVVRRMFADSDRGKLPVQIAEKANARRVLKKDGKRGTWCARDVLRILRNVAYSGRMRDGSDAFHDPIVARELFDRVEVAIARRRTREPRERDRRSNNDPFLLRGLMVCAVCRHRMTTSARGSLDGDPPRYYRCRRTRCRQSQLPAAAIEAYVIDAITTPRPHQKEPIRSVWAAVGSIWNEMFPGVQRQTIVGFVREVRCDVKRGKVHLELDDAEIANWVDTLRTL